MGEVIKKARQKAQNLKERYDKPTSIKWRRRGDALLAIGGVLTLFAPLIGVPWITATAGALTILGKFATNLDVKKE